MPPYLIIYFRRHSTLEWSTATKNSTEEVQVKYLVVDSNFPPDAKHATHLVIQMLSLVNFSRFRG